MTKQGFIEQYVLNRANTVDGAMDGEGSAKIASDTFDKIITLCNGETNLSGISLALIGALIKDMDIVIARDGEPVENYAHAHADLLKKLGRFSYRLKGIIEVNK